MDADIRRGLSHASDALAIAIGRLTPLWIGIIPDGIDPDLSSLDYRGVRVAKRLQLRLTPL